MNKILNNNIWQLKGFWPYVPFMGKSMELGNELMGVTDWIEAEVPGSIYKDLFKADLIEEPYFEYNSIKCEWVSNRWWLYKTVFKFEKPKSSKRNLLIFKGIDYKAHFYVNSVKIGEHEGMYRSATFDVTDLLKIDKENEISVLIENAPEEMAQLGYTSSTHTQKSRFNYKWDFGTRLVNLGIYDDVVIKSIGDNLIEDLNVQSDILNGLGMLDIQTTIRSSHLDNAKVEYKLYFEDNLVYQAENVLQLKEGMNDVNHMIEMAQPKLWYPNGHGKQSLYSLEIIVHDGDGISDSKTMQTGFRTLNYERNEGAPVNSLPYTVVINGKKIYIKGVNMVPLDHMYGCVDKKRYEEIVLLMKQANINLVRIWGGGLIEKEEFYRLCDENGIMIWQEFIQSSSGICNVPSTKDDFLELLGKTAEFVVKEKRNHISLVIWSGGNELTDALGVPVTYENKNIAMLKEIVERYDNKRLFLPTSASGPLLIIDPDKKGMNHDVHGPWKYAGAEAHYKLYNESDSLFHSEFGVDGLSCLNSLKKFLSPKNLEITGMTENRVWRHHGEWWDTYDRDTSIFGKIESLEDFVLCSQFIQAEGLRYALESNRRRMYQNSGSIIWQFNEPWPNVSCTAIVDYYNTPKLAYAYLAKAYSPIHISLKYDNLIYAKNDEFSGDVYVHNDMELFEGSILCEIQDKNEKGMYKEEWKVIIDDNSSKWISVIKWKLIDVDSNFFIKLSLKKDNTVYSNSYLFFIKNNDGFCNLPLMSFPKGTA